MNSCNICFEGDRENNFWAGGGAEGEITAVKSYLSVHQGGYGSLMKKGVETCRTISKF